VAALTPAGDGFDGSDPGRSDAFGDLVVIDLQAFKASLVEHAARERRSH
jgi:hypothetical protein